MSSVLLGAIFLAIWNSILFYGKSLGISVILFMVPLLFFIIYQLHVNKKINNRYGLLVIIPILLLSMTYFIFNSIFFRVFNIIVISILFILMYLYTIKPSFDIRVILKDMFSIVFEPIESVSDVLDDVNNKLCSTFKLSNELSKFLKSFIVIIPVIGIVLLLLSSADMVFGSLFKFFGDFIENITTVDFVGEMLGRIILIFLIFIYLSSSLYFLVRKYSNLKHNTVNLDIRASSYTINLLLTILNLIYIVFDVIQIRSLMLHQVSMNISYAEYARQGFFQLMFVSVINLGVILFAKVSVKKDNEKEGRYLRLASLMMVMLTLVIICSSFFRMYMYESEYGYTLLRLLVYVVLITETVLLIPTIIYIFNSNFNILKYYMIIGVVVYTLLNYVNVDYMIARRNVDRFYEVEKIDLNYLKNHGTDNVDVLVELFSETDDVEIHNSLVQYFRNLEIKMDGFQEYNISKKRSLDKLDRLDLDYWDVPKDVLFSNE